MLSQAAHSRFSYSLILQVEFAILLQVSVTIWRVAYSYAG